MLIDKNNIDKLSIREIAKKIALVPQFSSINFNFSVEEVIKMGRYSHVGRFATESMEDKRIIEDLLKKFNLIELKSRSFTELSGGEQQKVIICRALAQESKILLLDEPTTHLDINYEIELMQILKENVKNGLIVVVILHDLNLAALFCDKIVLLHKGRIEETLTKENIGKIFDVDVIIRKNLFNNSIFIIPIRNNSEELSQIDNKRKKRIHLITGGGAALEILPKLKNYKVSIGAVNVLDDDYALASDLNCDIVSEAPFSPISETTYKKLKIFVNEAEIVILTNTPFGKNNIDNLKVLTECEKKIIIYERDAIETRDFTGGLASQIYFKLKKKENVLVVNSLDSLFQKISDD